MCAQMSVTDLSLNKDLLLLYNNYTDLVLKNETNVKGEIK